MANLTKGEFPFACMNFIAVIFEKIKAKKIDLTNEVGEPFKIVINSKYEFELPIYNALKRTFKAHNWECKMTYYAKKTEATVTTCNYVFYFERVLPF